MNQEVSNPLPLCEPSAMPTADTAAEQPELGGKRARSAARTKGVHNETGRNPVILPDWLPPSEWQAFVEHRQDMRKPMTDEAQRRALKELGRLRDQGHDPVRVIDASIANGWQGLFPLKDGGQGQASKPGAIRGRQSAIEDANNRALDEWLGNANHDVIEGDYAQC